MAQSKLTDAGHDVEPGAPARISGGGIDARSSTDAIGPSAGILSDCLDLV
jgi:hypothetical protein